MSKNNNNQESATPYDVHRTLLSNCPSFIIPVVKEGFAADQQVTLNLHVPVSFPRITQLIWV